MFLFLLKASLVVAILLAFYKLFLEKESFFAVNRIYLLACIILAVALPFLSLPKLMENQGYLTQLLQEKETEAIADFIPTDTSVDFEKSEPIDVESNENERKRENENLTPTTAEVEMEAQITFDEETTEVLVETSENQSFGLSDWLFWIYLFGVGVLFLNLLAQMGTTLFKAIRNDDKIADEEGTIINLEEESEPCSFFKYIFIHPDSYDFETYEQIVAHEKIHVKQWHSIDLLLAEIAVALFWFNPFVWLFRKEVEKNIEYQTDDLLTRKVVKKEKKGYQLNLLKIATHNKPLTITTNYNQSLIKQRILKMNAKKSNPYSYWKYAFVAPVLLTLILAMNEPYTAASFELNELDHTVSYEEKTAVEAEEGDDMEKLHKIVEALRQRLKADKIVAVDDIVFQYKKGAITVNEQKLSKQQAARYLQFLKDNGVTIVGDKFQLHILPEKEHWRVSGKIEFNDPDREDNFNALMQAIKNDDLKAVKKYLARDVDLNRRDENGFTPLLLAAYEKHDLVAKAIVTHTAQQVNFEVNTSQARQWTASDLSTVDHKDFELFMRAIDDGDKELVTYFLDKGDIDVNGIGRHEFTPLMLAASEDHPEIVRLLIDRGARINFMNSNGWTALIEAADEGSYASAIVLIEAGADIDLHEKEGGRSAVVMSASEGHLNLLELLL
ncbi:MAG: ankyrin repeat domain-containing protein, partial [Bacteroidota bacterium]